ncbi:MAG TPA: helix-turn-helix transcriptional regulator, partial [Pseudomonadales bacterium]|nr:helix-turn-helix transcriptional regulator [Pseudomonadales bacterium]
AVVFIHNAEQPLARVTDVIGKVYGLSDQEAELVEAIAAGDSPEEIAHAAGRSIIAVRSQLKRVFRKTGTTKQAELMKLVLSGPIAMVR